MRFLVQGHNGAIPFAEVFLSEDRYFDKRLNAIDIPKLPRAFISNIGDMSSTDVAFIIFNQFFGESVGSDVIKDLTTRCFESLNARSEKSMGSLIATKASVPAYSKSDITAAIVNGLYHYYIDIGRVQPSANIVCYGSVNFLESAYRLLGTDTLLITNTSSTYAQKPCVPVFAINGDNLTVDGHLVATAVSKLNVSNKHTLLFTDNNVASILAYVFIIIEAIRQSAGVEDSLRQFAVAVTADDPLLNEAVRLVNALGFDVETVDGETSHDSNTSTITINRKSSPGDSKTNKRSGDLITRIAPSVSVIKQLIL